MGYPRDLDEYEEAELIRELAMREDERMAGNCDYCHRPSESTPCKFPGRHRRTVLSPVTMDNDERGGFSNHFNVDNLRKGIAVMVQVTGDVAREGAELANMRSRGPESTIAGYEVQAQMEAAEDKEARALGGQLRARLDVLRLTLFKITRALG